MKEKRALFRCIISRVLIRVALALVLVGIVCPAGISCAEGRVKPEWSLPKHYPDGFDGYGLVHRIDVDENEVVIDDRLMRLSPYASYHTPAESDVSSALFSSGNVVGFIIDSDLSIISIWLLK